jgi:hypothetical protein
MACQPCRSAKDNGWLGYNGDIDPDTGEAGISYKNFSAEGDVDSVFVDNSVPNVFCVLDPTTGQPVGRKQLENCTTFLKESRTFFGLSGWMEQEIVQDGYLNCKGNGGLDCTKEYLPFAFGNSNFIGKIMRQMQGLVAKFRAAACDKTLTSHGGSSPPKVKDLPEALLPHLGNYAKIASVTKNLCNNKGKETYKYTNKKKYMVNSGAVSVYAIAKGPKGQEQSRTLSSSAEAYIGANSIDVISLPVQCMPGEVQNKPGVFVGVQEDCPDGQKSQIIRKGTNTYPQCDGEPAAKKYCQASVDCAASCDPKIPIFKAENWGTRNGYYANNKAPPNTVWWYSNGETAKYPPMNGIGPLLSLCEDEGPYAYASAFKSGPSPSHPAYDPCLGGAYRSKFNKAHVAIVNKIYQQLKACINLALSDMNKNIGTVRGDAIAKYNAKYPGCAVTTVEIYVSGALSPVIATVGEDRGSQPPHLL